MLATPPPRWLWQIARWGLVASSVALLGLTAALAQGLTDPPRAGPLLWGDDFTAGTARWTLYGQGGQLEFVENALYVKFEQPATDQWRAALTEQPATQFTLEMVAAQPQGEIGIAYGLVFGWQDETHYQAVLINGNGYATAYTQAGTERREWYAWQQWPHILFGTEPNRVRIDVRGQQVIARVNDEWLAETDAATAGQVGLLAYGYTAGQVVFGWVQAWGR